ANDGLTGHRNGGAAPASDRIREHRHSAILPATRAESLAYTIRRRLRSRLEMTTPNTAVEATKKSEQDAVNVHYDTRLPDLPRSRRIQIPIIAAAVYSVIRVLGPTLRYEVLGWRDDEPVYAAKEQ